MVKGLPPDEALRGETLCVSGDGIAEGVYSDGAPPGIVCALVVAKRLVKNQCGTSLHSSQQFLGHPFTINTGLLAFH